MLKIVFDTNIYLAAMGIRSFCYELLITVLNQSFKYALFTSQEIIHEAKKGAAKLQKNKVIGSQTKEKILSFLKKKVNLAFPEEKIEANIRDKGDIKILECAAAANADLIITMDKDLLKLKIFRNTAIIHPKTFFYMLNPKK